MSVHDLVVATLSDLGMPDPIEVFETLLIMDGSFNGRKYHYDGGYAVWGIGWKAIEFYDADGKLLKMVGVKDAQFSRRQLNASEGKFTPPRNASA